jgi:hypothetical protein
VSTPKDKVLGRFFIAQIPLGGTPMQLTTEQLWELHDYLSDRNFTLYDEDDKETYTRWQHQPSGSVLKVINNLTMSDALTLAATAHAAHIAYAR